MIWMLLGWLDVMHASGFASSYAVASTASLPPSQLQSAAWNYLTSSGSSLALPQDKGVVLYGPSNEFDTDDEEDGQSSGSKISSGDDVTQSQIPIQTSYGSLPSLDDVSLSDSPANGGQDTFA